MYNISNKKKEEENFEKFSGFQVNLNVMAVSYMPWFFVCLFSLFVQRGGNCLYKSDR